MTQKLPQFTAREVIAILRRHGFEIDRQSGSHAILIHKSGRRVTVPVHSGRTIGKGLLRSIMNDAGLTPEDLTA
ncbi:MAG TPA: type II toxin-antitoxin system HicA family toxin [Thermoanaerobaculia bacterium]|nr:type II toxin-antitoxin system HicA family toxin [Thermoanaerobaculia bacterium]